MSTVTNTHGKPLTYRFNKAIFSEIEILKIELLQRLKTKKECEHLILLLIQKHHALERGKAISRGKAIAKQRKSQAEALAHV